MLLAQLHVQSCNVRTVDAYEIRVHEEARFHSLVLIALLRNIVVFMLRIGVHDIFENCSEHVVQGHRSAFEFDNSLYTLIAMVSFMGVGWGGD